MSKNILVVDDVKMNRKLVKGLLAKAMPELEILEAQDGYKALEILSIDEINVVILDIMMPGMNGIEVLEEMKANPRTKHIPVIMCSAIHESESIERALKAGALDYFTKPLSEEDMRINLPLKVRNAFEHYQNKLELVHFYNHIKDEMQLAERLQQSMVSEHEAYQLGEMWGCYRPCEEVGGDIYCSREVGGKLWFMIADVSGHGISAAMLSTTLNVIFNISTESCDQPEQLLAVMNEHLYKIFNGTKYGLVSAFVGYMTDKMICYANAGHPYPLLYKSQSQSFETLEARGFLLGMFDNRPFISESKLMHEGDYILLYTDGLFDKGVDKGFAKWGAVRQFCEGNSRMMCNDESTFMGLILKHFSDFEGRKFIDDVAFMLLRKK